MNHRPNILVLHSNSFQNIIPPFVEFILIFDTALTYVMELNCRTTLDRAAFSDLPYEFFEAPTRDFFGENPLLPSASPLERQSQYGFILKSPSVSRIFME